MITQEDLTEIIPTISIHDPRAYMLFMGPEQGRSRSQEVNLPIKDNLLEISIHIDGESDGSFDSEDRIIFYGCGPSGFELKASEVMWEQNLYFTSNTCWLLLPDDNSLRGKRVSQSQLPESTSLTLDYGLFFYHTEIDLINPDLIVTLGRHSFGNFFPGELISQARGTPRNWNGRTIFPVYHPAATLHNPRLKPILEEDFRKMKMLINNTQIESEKLTKENLSETQLTFDFDAHELHETKKDNGNKL